MSNGVGDPPRQFRQLYPAKNKPRKRAANVSVDADLLASAKAMKLNISAVLEIALKQRMREEKRKRFKEESRAAIESYNAFVEENGLWAEEYRDW